MKDHADKFTVDLLGKRPRGRPPKPDAMTGAQRTAAYRARLAEHDDQADQVKLLAAELLKLPAADLRRLRRLLSVPGRV